MNEFSIPIPIIIFVFFVVITVIVIAWLAAKLSLRGLSKEELEAIDNATGEWD